MKGRNNVEIAEILSVAPTTVYTYNNRIKQKLDIEDMPKLINFVLKHNMFAIDD